LNLDVIHSPDIEPAQVEVDAIRTCRHVIESIPSVMIGPGVRHRATACRKKRHGHAGKDPICPVSDTPHDCCAKDTATANKVAAAVSPRNPAAANIPVGSGLTMPLE
jgi:hypothetical protein